MNKLQGLATKLRALFKSNNTPLWIAIIILTIVIISQQVQLSELESRIDADHDGSTVESVAGRLYILEGMSNKHAFDLDDIRKAIRQLQNDGAHYDWQIKQLQWLHPELPVTPANNETTPLTSKDLTIDMNPGKVPDVQNTN